MYHPQANYAYDQQQNNYAAYDAASVYDPYVNEVGYNSEVVDGNYNFAGDRQDIDLGFGLGVS